MFATFAKLVIFLSPELVLTSTGRAAVRQASSSSDGSALGAGFWPTRSGGVPRVSGNPPRVRQSCGTDGTRMGWETQAGQSSRDELPADLRLGSGPAGGPRGTPDLCWSRGHPSPGGRVSEEGWFWSASSCGPASCTQNWHCTSWWQKCLKVFYLNTWIVTFSCVRIIRVRYSAFTVWKAEP